MTPQWCQVMHEPPHSYGDCLRACIATVMDMPWQDVPHFMDGHDDPYWGLAMTRNWLRSRGYTAFVTQFPAVDRAEMLSVMHDMNPDAVYLLFGLTEDGGGHVVVCSGGSVVHNPAMAGCHITRAAPGGWVVWVVSRI